MKNNYDSNASRRAFLRKTSAVGLGATILPFLLPGCTEDTPSEATVTTLRMYATGTLDAPTAWARLKSDLNIDLRFEDSGNETGPIVTAMTNGSAAREYDLGGLQGGVEPELAAAGAILPWDLSQVPNYQSIWSWIKDIPHTQHEGKTYGLPIVVNADSMIYLPEFTGEIDSYAAVFDPALKGRTSMEDSWINSVIFTAIFLKESGEQSIDNPGDLAEEELTGVMEFLIRKKEDGQFKTFWQGWEQGVKLVSSKEVVCMTGWEPIVKAAQEAGVDARYATPKEGYEGWSNDLVLHRGAETRGVVEAAHQFANWQLSGLYGATLAKERGYVVPNEAAVEFAQSANSGFEADEQRAIVNHVREKFQNPASKVYWQNVRPKNYKLYEDWWARLRNI